MAAGEYAFASGRDTQASGRGAVAMGRKTKASGTQAFAVGTDSVASGLDSVAMGEKCEASGDNAFAVGSNAKAQEIGAVAMGRFTVASNRFTLAAGVQSEANGWASCAIGRGSVATGKCEMALGSYNTLSTTNNRILSLGIGEDNAHRYDALIAFKNGHIRLNNSKENLGDTDMMPGMNAAQLQVDTGNGSDGIAIRMNGRGNCLNIAKTDKGGDTDAFISLGYVGGSYSEVGSIKPKGQDSISLNYSSDARLKSDCGPFTGSLDLVSRIRIHNFNWKSDNRPDIGVFAQELYEVFPAAVEKGDDGPEVQQRWMVDYVRLQPLAIAAVQELHQTVARQQQQIDQLQQQVAALLQRR